MGVITHAKNWMKGLRKPPHAKFIKVHKAILWPKASNLLHVPGPMIPSCGDWADGEKLAKMQKELDIFHNQRIDRAMMEISPWRFVYGTAFTFKTWSKVALRNLVKAIRW